MRKFLKILAVPILLMLVTGTNMAVSYIAPFPFNKVNIIFAALILYILLNKSGVVVWISFVLHYLVELYAVTPFGIVLFSGTLSILIVYWLSKEVFTNPRFIVAVGLSAIGLVVYRAVYVLCLLLHYIVSKGEYTSGLGAGALLLYTWELLLTTSLISIIYFVLWMHKGKTAETL